MTNTNRLTYTAVNREHNTWDSKTGISPITWDCGHKHRTLRAAYNCLQKRGTEGRCYHANLECSDGEAWDRMEAEGELNIRY